MNRRTIKAIVLLAIACFSAPSFAANRCLELIDGHIEGNHLDLRNCLIFADEMPQVADFLASHPNIISLDISENPIDRSDRSSKSMPKKSGVTTGTSLLAKNTTLKQLKVSDVDSEGAKTLAQNTTLKNLDLSYANIGTNGALALAQNQSLESLNIYGTGINDIEKVVDAFSKNTHLKSLNLGMDYLTDDAAIVLAKNTTLTALNADYALVTDAGFKALSNMNNLTDLSLNNTILSLENLKDIIQIKKLTSLHLYDDNIGDEGAKIIANNTNLTLLNLGENNLTAAGAKSIASIPNLTHLYLGQGRYEDEDKENNKKNKNRSTNQIGDDGAIAIANLKNLMELKVENNGISETGVAALAKSASLEALDLKYNQITTEGVRALASNKTITKLSMTIDEKDLPILAQNTHLIDLHLDTNSNTLSDEGARAIANNTSLLNLDLRAQHIPLSAIKILVTNHSLQRLSLLYWDVDDAVIAEIVKNTTIKDLTLDNYQPNNNIRQGAFLLAKTATIRKLNLGFNEITSDGIEALRANSHIVYLQVQRWYE